MFSAIFNIVIIIAVVLKVIVAIDNEIEGAKVLKKLREGTREMCENLKKNKIENGW